jgi:hypothetical protein
MTNAIPNLSESFLENSDKKKNYGAGLLENLIVS